MKKKKVHAKKSRQEKCILTVIAVLCVLALCVAGYGVWSMRGGGGISFGGVAENDPLMIRELIAGSHEAEILEEDGEYFIHLVVDEDFPFQKVALNLVLADGAMLSSETNCLLADLGGRPVVNLGVEDAALTIVNGEESRTYLFQIELM